MRWLESAPERYDAGMNALTFGRVALLHDAVAEAATRREHARVLEIGCGTGAVTQRLVARGAKVTAVDQNPEMLERARTRLAGVEVDWREHTAAEIDSFPADAFDAVVASLCLSEMSPSERRFVLKEAAKRLAPDGVLVVADEVKARGALAWLQWATRLPQAIAGWLLIGSVSRLVPDLAAEIRAAGLSVAEQRRWLLDTLCMVVAARP
jgi:demethylmenaquinone methyltransferase/2-methoxy-6-polyprenyl-1,4-benzoquinol methylase